VPIIPQDTPTVTKPDKVIEELRYHPVVIIKGHGTVAIGNSFQEAFLLTDLLEEAVRCQFFKEAFLPIERRKLQSSKNGQRPAAAGKRYELFSRDQHEGFN